MRQLAVDIPPLLDEDQRRVKYINRNGEWNTSRDHVSDWVTNINNADTVCACEHLIHWPHVCPIESKYARA